MVRIAITLALLLAAVLPARAVDLTGDWVICGDCGIISGCNPMSSSPTDVDHWSITQTGSNLSIDSTLFSTTFTGIIQETGVFNLTRPPNSIAWSALSTDTSIDGMYDSGLQQGRVVGARVCDPMAPACDDGDSCTDDACVTAAIGTCTDDPVQNYCTHMPNGSCVTTTTATPPTTTTTTMPFGQHPMSGQKLVIKRSASGRQTLIFVTKDPAAYVPAIGAPDDPSTVTTQIHLYSPVTDGASDLTIPPGVGKPGWLVKPVPGPQYKFTNSAAPAGISVVRTMKLRAGKGYKIVARATGFLMNQPLGAAGISIHWSGSTACAHFGAASVRKDTPPQFIAGPSPAPLNCNGPTLRAP